MTKICVKTYGCAHNQADSETMIGFLLDSGFEIDCEDYDLIIFNTCTVKNPTEDKFFSTLAYEEKPVVICGCIPQSSSKDLRLEKYSLVGLDNLDKIVDAVNKTLKGEVVRYLDRRKFEREEYPSYMENPLIAKIPILQGCLGSCAYCKTKMARGGLRSFSMESIINQIRKVKGKVSEIWLVSQDNGCYGLDINLTLIDLLKEIVKIGLDCKVRIGMLNPNFAFEYRYDLADILVNDCFYKFLHIPVQSGSDDVLVSMGRKYSVSQFEEALKVIKSKNLDITYSTDIICGFPTETLEDFKKTIALVSKWEFVMINVSKFYPRKGTVAASMKLLPTDVVKERSSKLMKLIKEQNPLERYLGSKLKVNFVEKNIGYTDNYLTVEVSGENSGVKEVKIVSVGRFSMKGIIS